LTIYFSFHYIENWFHLYKEILKINKNTTPRLLLVTKKLVDRQKMDIREMNHPLTSKNKQSFILPCIVIIHLNPLFEKVVNTMGVEFYLTPIKNTHFKHPKNQHNQTYNV
jgi:hypothetical protein